MHTVCVISKVRIISENDIEMLEFPEGKLGAMILSAMWTYIPDV